MLTKEQRIQKIADINSSNIPAQNKIKALQDFVDEEKAEEEKAFKLQEDQANQEVLYEKKAQTVQKVELVGIEVVTLKGEKGDKPSEEELLKLIKPLIPKPAKGNDGYTPTVKELKGIIKPLIPKPIPGEPGKSPDPESIIAEILGRIEVPEPAPGRPGEPGKDGSSDTAEQIIKKLQTLEKAWLDIKAIKGFHDLIEQVRGDLGHRITMVGALSALRVQSAGLQIGDAPVKFLNFISGATLNDLGDGVVGVTVTASGSAYTPTEEDIPGTGTSFTLSHTPNETNFILQIYLNGILQKRGVGKDYTISGSTITLATAKLSTDLLTAFYQY